MINWFNHNYPYTDFHELNLDWVIATIRKNEGDIKNFIGLNTIKYSDPILWNITSQYEANTVVVDGQTGNAYISIQAVPGGVHLNNSDYWTQIYNYANVVDTLREQIASNEGATTTATKTYSVGALVFANELLYRVISPIVAGDTFVTDSNVVETTIEAEIQRVSDTLQPTISELQENLGDLDDLTTTDKTSAVSAINEVLSTLNSIAGNLSSLSTEDKTSLVNAVNELNTTYGDYVESLTESISSLDSDITDGLKNRTQVVNILDYGADNTGATSSAVAIADALDDIGTVARTRNNKYCCKYR